MTCINAGPVNQVLGSGYKGTCETDATCNLYVVLVMYRDGDNVLCDYLRFWSPAGSGAEFHHRAMRAVKEHLTGPSGKVKNLRRMYVWTDGHASTYKVLRMNLNFGSYLDVIGICMAGFPKFWKNGLLATSNACNE